MGIINQPPEKLICKNSNRCKPFNKNSTIIIVPTALINNLQKKSSEQSENINSSPTVSDTGTLSYTFMYIEDPLSACRFIIDTNMHHSLMPCKFNTLHPSPTGAVSMWSGDCVETYGRVQTTLTFGTDTNFNWNFQLADVEFPILGVDFLDSNKAEINYNNCTIKLQGKVIKGNFMPPQPLLKTKNEPNKDGKLQDNGLNKLPPASYTPNASTTGGISSVFAVPIVLHMEDKDTGKLFLVDSGASKSVVPPLPSDLPNKTFTLDLRAANGSEIATYGTRNLSLDFGLGRTYEWSFLIADVQGHILGMDFLRAFHWCIDAGSDAILDQLTLQKAPCHLKGKVKKPITQCPLLLDSSCKYAILLREFPELTTDKPNLNPKHNYRHHINTPNSPVYCKPRLLSPEMHKVAKAAFDKMVSQGIVSPATSEWCSPLHFVMKRDGSYRLVGDYRKLNNITARDVYPLPFLQSFSADLHGKRVFSKIDLKEAFLQIPVATEDIEKTTVTTPFGAFSYNYMPYGLSGAAQTFQRFITEVMRNLNKTNQDQLPEEITTFSYIDDILVASADEESHIEDLTTLFKRLSEYGLRVNPEKCEFGKSSLSFLGHHINEQGIRPLPEKVSAILQLENPTTVKELRRYLGMLNFYRRFIPHAAETLIPLYDLLTKHNKLSKNAPLHWTVEAERSFNQAKNALANVTLLAYPAPGAELTLAADASDIAIGAVLQQKDSLTGEIKPLGFFSRRLTDQQKKLTVFARELLAAYAGLRHFLYFLQGRPFTILTDHQALINAAKNAGERESKQEVRQLHFIGEYTSSWQHIAGSSNITADTLSRPINSPNQPNSEPSVQAIAEHSVLSPNAPIFYPASSTFDPSHTHYSYISTISKSSPKLQYISSNLRHADYDELHLAQQNDAELHELLSNQQISTNTPKLTSVNGLCCHEFNNIARPFIPQILRKRVFHITHDVSHPAPKRTVCMIASRFYWPDMKRQVTLWSRSCLSCQAAKINRHNIAPVIQMVPASEKFGSINVDFVGPLPNCKGYQYIMTAIDRYSRWVEAIPLQSATAETTADCLIANWISRYGIPESITTDRGPNFQSELFNHLLKRLGCTHYSTTAYHPQHNGLIERFHRTVKDSLRASSKNTYWVERLPLILLMLRTSPRSDGQPSPAEIVFGTTLRLPIDLLVPPTTREYLDPADYSDRLKEHMQKVTPIITKHNISSNTSYIDPRLKIASKVWVRNMTKKGLEPNYVGPFDVLKLSSNYVTIRRHNGRTDTVSVNNVKACFSQEDILQVPLMEPIPRDEISKNTASRPSTKKSVREDQDDLYSSLASANREMVTTQTATSTALTKKQQTMNSKGKYTTRHIYPSKPASITIADNPQGRPRRSPNKVIYSKLRRARSSSSSASATSLINRSLPYVTTHGRTVVKPQRFK